MQLNDVTASSEGSGARALLVAFLVLLGVLFSIFLGVLIGRALTSNQWINPVLCVAGALLLVWATVLIVALIPSLLRFVRCETVDGPPFNWIAPIALLFLALLLLSAFAIRTSLQPSPRISLFSSLLIAESGAEPTPVVLPPEKARDYFIVPFNDVEGSSKDCTGQNFGNAQLVLNAYKPAIRLVADALRNCAANGKIPEVDVRGFASTSKFQGCVANGAASLGSDELNLMLAAKRRDAVIHEIRAVATNAAQLRIYEENNERRWATFEDMSHELRVIDAAPVGTSADRQYSTERGVLTRRAEIVITDLGDCTQELPAAGPTAEPSGGPPSVRQPGTPMPKIPRAQ